MQAVAVRVTFRDQGDSLRNGELLSRHIIVEDNVVIDHDGEDNIDVVCYSRGGGAFFFRTHIDSVIEFEKVDL